MQSGDWVGSWRNSRIAAYRPCLRGTAGSTVAHQRPHYCHCWQNRIRSVAPKVIILSGGPNSVHLDGAPRVPDGFFDFCAAGKIPVLGICYGMQMITHMLGGEVKPATTGGEYGRMPIDITPGSTLFSSLDKSTVNVWMSHGDEAVLLPAGFTSVAKSHGVSMPLLYTDLGILTDLQ